MKTSELINYRTYNGQEIPILTIKKGTLLFRSALTPNVFINDYLGLNIEENKYCLPSNYNVFFSLCPYVFDTNMYFNRESQNADPHTAFYVLVNDVQVVLMVKPSTIIRAQEDETNAVSWSCDHYTFCGSKKGRSYDPCLYENFIKENMDIHGMICIQDKDADNFVNRYYKQKRFSKLRKFVNFVKDQKTVGSPELILYPRKVRSLEDITTLLDPADFNSYYSSNYMDYNYYPLEIFKHKTYDDNDAMYHTLLKLLSPVGTKIDDQHFHASIDKRTYFYAIYETFPEKDKLVELSESKKLDTFKKSNSQFIFKHVSVDLK